MSTYEVHSYYQERRYVEEMDLPEEFEGKEAIVARFALQKNAKAVQGFW